MCIRDRVYGGLRRAGYPVFPIPEIIWYRQLHQRAGDPSVYPAAVLATAVGFLGTSTPLLPTIDSAATQAAMHRAGVTLPPLDDEFFDRLIDQLIARRTLPGPDHR